MNETTILLDTIMRESKMAEELLNKPYNERGYAAFQCTRIILRTLASTSTQPAVAPMIDNLIDTLEQALNGGHDEIR